MILEHYTSLRYVIGNVPFLVKMDVYKGYSWLFLIKTWKGRKDLSCISGFKQHSSSRQPGHPSTCLEDHPALRHGSASPSNTHKCCPALSYISIFHTVSAEEHAHLHPQNNREINEDDCNSQSLVSAAVERSNKLRL